MFNLAQTVVYKGFNQSAYVLAITDTGYVLALNSGYTFDMTFEQAHRVCC